MIRATAFRQPTRQPLFASASSAQLASFSTDTGTQQRARTDSIMFVPALKVSAPPENMWPVAGSSSPQQLRAMPSTSPANRS